MHVNGTALLGADAIKRGLAALSEQRVQDTLLAEAGEHAALVERFRDGKTEHNQASIAQVLGQPEATAKESVRILMEIGFLEQVGETFKIPMLYRDGLNLTQGKAFQ